MREDRRRFLHLVRWLVVALAALTATVVATPRPAYGCTCSSDRPFSAEAASVDVAFSGGYVKAFYNDLQTGTAVFRVDRVYKGRAGPYFITRDHQPCNSVTPHPDYDTAGGPYGFIAEGGTYPTLRFCDSTVVLDVLTDSFGAGYPPEIAILERQLADLPNHEQVRIPREAFELLRERAASDPAVSPHISAELLEDRGATSQGARLFLYTGLGLLAGAVVGIALRLRKRGKAAPLRGDPTRR